VSFIPCKLIKCYLTSAKTHFKPILFIISFTMVLPFATWRNVFTQCQMKKKIEVVNSTQYFMWTLIKILQWVIFDLDQKIKHLWLFPIFISHGFEFLHFFVVDKLYKTEHSLKCDNCWKSYHQDQDKV
jgi:hypothetical protein